MVSATRKICSHAAHQKAEFLWLTEAEEGGNWTWLADAEVAF